jgi:putative glutathione S-transferase
MAYVNPKGEFNRDTAYITDRITADGRDGYPVEPGRYRLVVARACPWANRAIIVRRLLGLEDVLSVGFCGPTHDERSWTFDLDPGGVDPVLKIPRLQDAYFRRDPNYPKGITVPAIVDIQTGAVVTNDFAQITLDLSTEWTAHHRDGAPELYPREFVPRSTRLPGVSTPRSTTACTAVGSPGPRTPMTRPMTGCSPHWTG